MYIDPAAGSLILQVLAAGVLSALAVFKRARAALVGYLRNLFARRKDS
jgi:hypothetical protein